MKLLRTIRLDPSDTFIFEKVAEPGEWAVSGAFMFWASNPDALEGKARSAFRGGLLGVASLGWSTLVQVVEASESDRSAAAHALAEKLVAHFGAPDLATARKAADEELAFASSLAEHPKDTLVAVHRRYEDGEIRETFRTLRPREGQRPLRAFSFLDVEEESPSEPVEQVDLADLAGLAGLAERGQR
jgi:hypothetical protein